MGYFRVFDDRLGPMAGRSTPTLSPFVCFERPWCNCQALGVVYDLAGSSFDAQETAEGGSVMVLKDSKLTSYGAISLEPLDGTCLLN